MGLLNFQGSKLGTGDLRQKNPNIHQIKHGIQHPERDEQRIISELYLC